MGTGLSTKRIITELAVIFLVGFAAFMIGQSMTEEQFPTNSKVINLSTADFFSFRVEATAPYVIQIVNGQAVSSLSQKLASESREPRFLRGYDLGARGEFNSESLAVTDQDSTWTLIEGGKAEVSIQSDGVMNITKYNPNPWMGVGIVFLLGGIIGLMRIADFRSARRVSSELER